MSDFKLWGAAMTEKVVAYDPRKLSPRELAVYATLLLQLGGILFAAGKFSEAVEAIKETVAEMKLANATFAAELTNHDRAIIRLEGRVNQLEGR